MAASLRDCPDVLCLKTIREMLIFHMKLLYSVFVLVLIIGFVCLEEETSTDNY